MTDQKQVKERTFVRHRGALCLEGYPIRISRPGPNGWPWGLEHDGQPTQTYVLLAVAKLGAFERADEIDEFEGN
jgi:hypothetical protein